MRLARTLFVAVFGLLLILAGLSTCHAHDFWINHGNYKSPDGVHCCGENDCQALPEEDVSIGPGGYSLILRARDGSQSVEIVPFSEAQPSEDGHYWRCKRYDGSRRCFFAPQPGS